MTDHKKKGDFTGAPGRSGDSQGGNAKQDNQDKTPGRTMQNSGGGGRR